MRYLLDIDHISILERPRSPQYHNLTRRLMFLPQTEFAFSIVSLHEQFLGCHALINRAKNAAHVVRGYELLDQLRDLYATARVLKFDDSATSALTSLEAMNLRPGMMDLRIAATALSRNLTLLTRNVADFSRILGLVTADWTL